ncbi:MAG: alpha/beta hydrolase [Gemmatimonadetes bacterium]|nr:alpha/beta hydrolase [Gemmatimonadota bacterium]
MAACSDQTATGVATERIEAPLLDVTPGILAVTNVPYATRSASQKLDIHLPTTGAKPYPVVLWIHGGGWSSGDKQLSPTNAVLTLLTKGIAVVSINYRLSGEAKWPAQMHDVKAALRWVRANAAAYNLDANRVGAWGLSAGGHLAAMLGTTDGIASLTDLSLGNPTMSEKVKAVADWFGPVAFLSMDAQLALNGCPLFGGTGHSSAQSPESKLVGAPIPTVPNIVQSANPRAYVTAGDAKFLIMHGTKDCTVPYQQSQAMAARLNAVMPGSAALQLLQGEAHGGPGWTSAPTVGVVTTFFKNTL